MANCESLSKCPFFHDKMAKKTVLAYVYKQRFCKGDNSQCARYAVLKYLGKGNIPADLYPNEMTKARAIILAGSKDIDTTSIMCECFDTCDLFSCEIAKLPTTSKSFQNKFCSMDNNACARYIVYKQLGEKHVPTDLFPNERGRAMKLIEAV